MKKLKKQSTLQEGVIAVLESFQKELDLAMVEFQTTLQHIDQKARSNMRKQVNSEAKEQLQHLKS